MTVSRKLTIREIAEELNIAYGSAQDILVNDLGLRRVAGMLVPKDLDFMQKRDRVDEFLPEDKPIIQNVSRIGASAGISALQSMGCTLEGTISIMMNKLVFLILKIKS